MKIGDKAYGSFGKYSRIDVREGEVINVSATGVIRVKFATSTISFNARGRERGRQFYDGAQLISADQYADLLMKQKRQQAITKAHDAVRKAHDINIDRAGKEVVIAALQAAVAAVQAIPEG